ncbi:PREDICTED: uncharacterized protein LOC107331149 isoform X2 [Acropora digitifera]|uniref:uncharacterized protein LOC107331149 isoform X2 n=1 Tax=Acropora digitifera TaxID=70779 RepID=UPI00077A86FF|nr:PREDICTED: uncharacterized protein LOC107331149 isoform X2 [Acropora digitifera]
MSHDAEDDVRKQVSPLFLKGLLALESFVQVLENTPNDVSTKAAQRKMSDLLGFVTTFHAAFCLAATTLHQINDKLDNDLQTVVVEEKRTSDSLNTTQQSLVKLEEKVKVLQDQGGELEEQLSELDENLEREEEYLQQQRKLLQKTARGGMEVVGFASFLGGILGGPIGLAAGGAVAMAAHRTAVSSAQQSVIEISKQVTSTQRRFATKETELRKLKHEQEDLEKFKRSRYEELELLKAKKEQIKKFQESLAKLNYSIKSCTTFVDTTASRAKMMADEAHGELPDIEAMVLPLKAIAGDIAEASLCDTRLLSGRVDMKGISAKIKAITSKAEKSVTCSETDEWKLSRTFAKIANLTRAVIVFIVISVVISQLYISTRYSGQTHIQEVAGRCSNCRSNHHGPVDNSIGAMSGVKADAEDDVRKQVSPHFLRGFQALESFVQVLENTPNVSTKAAQRKVSDLLGFLITSHDAFCLATTTLHQINDKLDNDLQTVVVEEKSTSDSLNSTQQSLVKLEEKVKVLQDQCGELEEQLSKLDENLEREEEYLQQQRELLQETARGGMIVVGFGLILGGIFGGPVGFVVGGAMAKAVHYTAVSSAEQAVNEASDQVARAQRRYAIKETELRRLKDEQEDQEKFKRSRYEELELLKAKMEQIKKSQEILTKLNYSIKSCTTFVDTTASRAKMMADEAHGELPDIEAMVPPLKAIAGDIAEASLCDTRLLSGRVDMKGISAKIKAITAKAEKSVTFSETDEWKSSLSFAKNAILTLAVIALIVISYLYISTRYSGQTHIQGVAGVVAIVVIIITTQFTTALEPCPE